MTKQSDLPPILAPPLILSAKSRIYAALVYAACVSLAGLPASLSGFGTPWAVVATSVIGGALVYIIWSVKTPALDFPLEHQDLVDLLAYMKGNRARERVLLEYLSSNFTQLWELTYCDARMMIKKLIKSEYYFIRDKTLLSKLGSRRKK